MDVTMWKWLTVTLLLIIITIIGFAIAIQQPATRGAIECWLRDSVDAPIRQNSQSATPIIPAIHITEPVRDGYDTAYDVAI